MSTSGTVFVVDARGLKCPLPVLKAEKALARLSAGETLSVLATDPMARIDLVLFCRQNGHGVAVTENEGWVTFDIVVGGQVLGD